MSIGVITLDFFEVGYPINGVEYGSFQGSAEIDVDGRVVAISLDPLAKDEPFAHIDVKADNTFAMLIAAQIQSAYGDTIADKLNDWHVSLAEREWEAEAVA